MSDKETMLNFAPPTRTPAPVRTEVTKAPVLRETVRITRTESSKAYLLKDSTEWDWQDLQAYVVTKILEIHGPFPRDDRKEFGIFKGFLARHGSQAGPIAQFAFEQADGTWKGSPISVTRFCKGSDPYFADPIKARLS